MATQEEEPPRAAWDNKVQFMLSIIGYSVGLGNIWRFPYLCQQNGGGAFLIPFVIMLVLEGIPLFLIELGIGQKMRLGAVGVWNTIHPWLGGLGVASCTVTFFVALYYNVIITWCFYYLFNSFLSPLPWSYCPERYNGTISEPEPECIRSSETAYFWYRKTLDVSPSIDETGGLKWWIVLCLLLAWVVVFFIVMKGIQSSGKVVYFTSMFPYIVLTIFFVRGITLKGAGAGLVHMYTPKVEKLLNPNVWLDAATQVFYSFGLAFGSLIAFGSYNPPKNNCVRDVILVSITNAITAIYASLVVFAILGFKAMSNVDKCMYKNKITLMNNKYLTTLEISQDLYDAKIKAANASGLILPECSLQKQLDQAAEGTGLAFIVFTQAIVELPGAPFWAVIFFMMLLSLGIGSQIGILEGMLSCIFDIDFFKRIRKPYLTGFVCTICFIVGLIFASGAGEYWLKLFDSFAGTIGLVMIALLEMLAVMFIYGHEKFTQDIEDMTGYRPGLYWQITWRFLAPAIMSCILVSSVIFRIINKSVYSAWDKDKVSTATIYKKDLIGFFWFRLCSLMFRQRFVRHAPDFFRAETRMSSDNQAHSRFSLEEVRSMSDETLVKHSTTWSKPEETNQGETVEKEYPNWVMGIAVAIISSTILPIFLVFLLRRFQVVKLDVDIHQGAIRRIDTTVSTKEMIRDVDVDEYDSQEEFEEEEDDRGGKSFKMEVMEF